jgi:flagellar basal body-associated protein FliL
MMPVTQKEMKMAMVNNLVNNSKKSEDHDWMHWTLIVLLVLLVVLLIVLIFQFLPLFSSNGKAAKIGDTNVEQRSNGELYIMDFDETSDSIPKGGK